MHICWVLACALLLHGGASPVAAQSSITADNLTDEHVRKAIQTLVDSLYERQHPQRFWEPEKIPANESSTQGGGYTALAILALLNAGQSYQDPRLRDAIEYLAAAPLEGTYAVATRAMVWARLPARLQSNLAADAKWLLDGFSEKNGGWDYIQKPTAKYHDNSIRQFGALALWEASKRDLKIDRRVWQRLEDAYINMQVLDGGWNYKGEGPATGSMTAAGLATLFITQDLLHASEALKLGAPAASRHSKSIDTGLKWMDSNFSSAANPGKDTYFFYYLYGVERVGLASGYKFFAGRDWFREGAAELIRRLLKWDAASQTFTLQRAAQGASRTDDVAFALLFLCRGRVPVAFNKVEFPGAWNNRPRDVANLTRWITENSETELNWQIININSDPATWLDAPVLYLASHESLPWMKGLSVDPNAWAKQVREFLRQRAAGELEAGAKPPPPPNIAELSQLKRYLDLGGLIFAVNEGGSRTFTDSIEKAGLLMYPQYQWRALPEDHWAYGAQIPVKGKRPALRGLSNGVRELIVLAPGGDLTATFQKHDVKELGDYQTAANLYFYGSELNRPRPRLARHTHATSSKPAQRSLTIVRALHEGNWKPEPLALDLFAQAVREQHGVQITVSDHPLSAIHELSPRPALVMVSGIERHPFTPQQIIAIKTYITSGGVILVETPGGRGEFTASVEEMAAALFEKPLESVLRTRIITGEDLPTANDLTQVEYRPFTLQTFGTRETAPRLRGITIDDARGPQLLFSREDITHALLDQLCWGVSGYSPQSARDLLWNIVQHAAELKD